MVARKIHEMTFTQFAQAIVPCWRISLTDPSNNQPSQAQWLASLWSGADRRVTYSISWQDGPLRSALPPDALTYQFNDLALHATTQELGLDSKSDTDNRKVAELLAARNAWLSAIQAYCQQFSGSLQFMMLADEMAHDHVYLICNWLHHPWVQERVHRYVMERDQEIQAQAKRISQPLEMSNDPLWPSTQVILAYGTPLSAQELEKRNGIDYWIETFESDNRKWSSEFEMVAWEAQSNMDIANRKIIGLQEIIEKQRSLIQGFKRVIRINKRREAEISNTDQRGRPKKSAERQTVALKFTAQWVQTLMDALAVTSCAQLQESVANSSQRNWQRWLTGQAVPTSKSLLALQAAKITNGSYQGQLLQEIATIPPSAALLTLIRLTDVVSKKFAFQ